MTDAAGPTPSPIAVDSSSVYVAPACGVCALSLYAVPIGGGEPVQLVGDRTIQANPIAVAQDATSLHLAAQDSLAAAA